LTHHWLDQRLLTPAEARGGGYTARSPGYFLEEGFATLVEEFEFDLRSRTWRTLDPRADSLDTVANSPSLLPWALVLGASQNDFMGFSRRPEHEVPMRWRLGRHRTLSAANLFYAQSAAVCHYLIESGGESREALLRWVRDLHAGRTRPGEVQARTGVSAEELGRRVVAWCRAGPTPAGR
jgi:hypothetical protein